MEKNNDKDWQEAFKADLKVLEDVHHMRVPEQAELLTALQQFKEKRKKAFARELIAFLVTALVIFTSYAMIALKLATVFIWIQGITFFIVPIVLIVVQRRRNSRNEVFRNGSE